MYEELSTGKNFEDSWNYTKLALKIRFSIKHMMSSHMN